jgi:glycosyltransferase involved in cell wall biosynthesis
MKVSGFTFIRNAVRYDFPVIEAITSTLPIVDEFIVNVGKSDDGTLELIRSIPSDKVRIVESVWDESLKKDGLIYSQQTNIALAQCTGDWAVYVQGDEVIHEQDLPAMVRAMKANLDNRSVKGLLSRYLHFMGDYWSLNPWFYHRAVRVIRNNGETESCGDAVGFHVKATRQYLQSGPREWLADSGTRMFHYGWVKEPKTMLAKKREQVTVYTDRLSPVDERQIASEAWIFEEYDILKNFTGTHPAVMRERVNRFPKLKPGRNRWLEPAFYRAIAKKGFRG